MKIVIFRKLSFSKIENIQISAISSVGVVQSYNFAFTPQLLIRMIR